VPDDGPPRHPSRPPRRWAFLPPGPPAARLLVVWGAFATSHHFDDVAAHLAGRGVAVLSYHHRGVAL
jgi:alpha-beta hydrolase superfamily lysophospholipase